MNTKLMRPLGLAALLLLGACRDDLESTGEPLSEFGEANRQTMLAQTVNPEPEYDTAIPPTSAGHAAQAIDRYATDRVKKPERVRSTESTGSGSSQ